MFKLTLTILHIYKIISIFNHNYPEKLIETSPPIEFAPPIARPTVKPGVEIESSKALTKQKRGQHIKVNNTRKGIKKS